MYLPEPRWWVNITSTFLFITKRSTGHSNTFDKKKSKKKNYFFVKAIPDEHPQLFYLGQLVYKTTAIRPMTFWSFLRHGRDWSLNLKLGLLLLATIYLKIPLSFGANESQGKWDFSPARVPAGDTGSSSPQGSRLNIETFVLDLKGAAVDVLTKLATKNSIMCVYEASRRTIFHGYPPPAGPGGENKSKCHIFPPSSVFLNYLTCQCHLGNGRETRCILTLSTGSFLTWLSKLWQHLQCHQISIFC